MIGIAVSMIVESGHSHVDSHDIYIMLPHLLPTDGKLV